MCYMLSLIETVSLGAVALVGPKNSPFISRSRRSFVLFAKAEVKGNSDVYSANDGIDELFTGPRRRW